MRRSLDVEAGGGGHAVGAYPKVVQSQEGRLKDPDYSLGRNATDVSRELLAEVKPVWGLPSEHLPSSVGLFCGLLLMVTQMNASYLLALTQSELRRPEVRQ